MLALWITSATIDAMGELDFYFDFISPYAYLAWKRAPVVLSVKLRPRPVLLGVLLTHFGQLGPAEIPPKRVFTIRDTMRRAADAKIELRWPLRHPFRSLAAIRVATAAVHEERVPVVDAIFEAVWARGEDVEDLEVVRAALEKASLPVDLIDRSKAKEISFTLRKETDEAIARGVFGVPTIFIGDEGFFGDDQLERVERCRKGSDPLDRGRAREVEARPLAVVRTKT